MTRALVAASAALLVVGMATPALAAQNENAVLAFHLKPAAFTKLCTNNNPNNETPPRTCDTYRTDAAVDTAYIAYMVVARAEEIAGMECGLEYLGPNDQGVVVGQWFLCADLEFANAGPRGDWPEAGSGNRITWERENNCQNQPLSSNGVHAVAGAFYIYSYGPDEFKITPNRTLVSGSAATVADCQAAQASIDTTETAHKLARVSFGSTGLNPCDFIPNPVNPATWGQIKKQYQPGN
jgi:hypothetical protein